MCVSMQGCSHGTSQLVLGVGRQPRVLSRRVGAAADPAAGLTWSDRVVTAKNEALDILRRIVLIGFLHYVPKEFPITRLCTGAGRCWSSAPCRTTAAGRSLAPRAATPGGRRNRLGCVSCASPRTQRSWTKSPPPSKGMNRVV